MAWRTFVKTIFMQLRTELLRQELLTITERLIAAAKELRLLSPEQLNQKKNPDSWSILECLEHLNLYGDFYLPAIEKQMIAHSEQKPEAIFRSGIIGNYFANLMRKTKGNKMKSPADKNPSNSVLSVTTIDRFIKQQELLKSLLQKSGRVSLTRVKVPISISKLIRLRLGDTLRFVVYHNERHVAQAQRCINNLSQSREDSPKSQTTYS